MGMIKFRAPALPLPREEYDRQYFDQFIRVLTLYFNQLDSTTPLQNDYYVGGGWLLTIPHISASDSTDPGQVAGGNNTPTVVEWNTLDSGFGWTLAAPGAATAEYAGVYKITYSLQFINTANAIHYATVWLKVNNNDVANSATIFTIPARKSGSPGQEGYICGYSEATFTAIAGDEVELYWATDLAGNPTSPTNGVYIYHDGAQVSPFVRPAIPSVIGSITFVSSLLYKTVVRLSSVSASGSLGTVSIVLGPPARPLGVSASGSLGTVSVTIGP